jgi:intracellular septation protein
MKLLFDLFPVILFFVVYKTHDIFAATAVAIVASLVQTLWFWYQNKRFERTHVITFVMLLVFGGLTIILREPAFVMWKVSIINILFGMVFLGSMFVGSKTIIERMMGSQVDAPKAVWIRINLIWTGLFFIIAALNAWLVLSNLKAREEFYKNSSVSENDPLAQLDCQEYAVPDLCLAAQTTEATWVNFKLFGTMGLTILVTIITVMMIGKYFNDKE